MKISLSKTICQQQRAEKDWIRIFLGYLIFRMINYIKNGFDWIIIITNLTQCKTSFWNFQKISIWDFFTLLAERTLFKNLLFQNYENLSAQLLIQLPYGSPDWASGSYFIIDFNVFWHSEKCCMQENLECFITIICT